MLLPGGILRNTDDNGLMFHCPGCDGPHIVHHGEGAGPRWSWNGSTDAPTFKPSVLVRWHEGDPHNAGIRIDKVCHSFVTDGKIQFLNDCTHALAGKTVQLPEWGSR